MKVRMRLFSASCTSSMHFVTSISATANWKHRKETGGCMMSDWMSSREGMWLSSTLNKVESIKLRSCVNCWSIWTNCVLLRRGQPRKSSAFKPTGRLWSTLLKLAMSCVVDTNRHSCKEESVWSEVMMPVKGTKFCIVMCKHKMICHTYAEQYCHIPTKTENSHK